MLGLYEEVPEKWHRSGHLYASARPNTNIKLPKFKQDRIPRDFGLS